MSGLTVSSIHKSFDNTPVLKGINFKQQPGEVLALLGPSGCGKSTLLAVIAGLIQQDSGQVQWNGTELSRTPPHKRGFGLMFQDYALFPHMNVRGNVAFGLQMQKLPRAELDEKVTMALRLVGLPVFGDRDVSTLSGGEQQRVALARALAPEPALLMLDEPLGSLDRTLRAQLLEDLRGIVRAAGQTTLYVTHDQEEAYALADRIVVMQAGQVAQIGSPRQIYHSPKSAFVARFIGLTNLIPGKASGEQAATPLGSFRLQETAHGEVQVLLRPDAARMQGPGHPLTGKVIDIAFMGETTRVQVQVQGFQLSFEFPSSMRLPAPGEELTLYIDTTKEVRSYPHNDDQ